MSAAASSATRPPARPDLVAHADWGSDPDKRWMCVADRMDDGSYRVAVPELVGDTDTLLDRLRDRSPGPGVMVGFDFPIGLPSAYAQRAGITCFLDTLPEFGTGRWSDFYELATSSEEISLTRPFYPRRPGGTKQCHLVDALGVESMDDVLRECERGTASRGAASSVFWTLGGKQVGRAAIVGWREVLAPALHASDSDVFVWPFDGDLTTLLGRGGVVITETYPAEAGLHLGLPATGRGWSKRSQEGRAAQAATIRSWARGRAVDINAELMSIIFDGFGPSEDAEDPFDATVGLLSMIDVALGGRPAGAPATEEVRQVEGWILGQAAGG